MSTNLSLNSQELFAKYLHPHQVDRYFQYLMEENRKVNLVSRETKREDFDRLMAESLLPLEVLDQGFGSFLDIGSGGGFPAIPLLMSERVFGETILLERTQKKAAALQKILGELDLPATVLDKDYEHFQLPSKFDLITLRYVKLTSKLLARLAGHLSDGGVFVYYSTPEFKVPEFNIKTYSFVPLQVDVVKSFSLLTLRR